MNHKAFALISVLLVVGGAFFCCSVVDDEDSSAANTGSAGNPLTSLTLYAWSSDIRGATFYVAAGSFINLVSQDDPCDGHSHFYYFQTAIGLPESGYVSSVGSYGCTIYECVSYWDDDYECYDYAEENHWFMTIVVVQNNCTVSFNANGGSATSSSTTVSQGSQISLPSASKAYCTFSGWYTAASGGTRVGGAGDSYTVSSNTTLYAQYNVIPVSITTTQGTAYLVQGTSFAYTVGTSPTDASVSVSGADWLTVSNKTVTGVPTVSAAPAGTYHVTVTAQYGTQSAVQTFDIVVAEKLTFESVPTGGIIAVPA